MTRAERRRFRAWLITQGAAPLDSCQNEVARFRAQDTLCIVYERNRKGKQSFVPELAREAFAAWQAKQTLDLGNTPERDVRPTSHREQADIVCGMVERVRAGESLDIETEASRTGFAAERIIAIGTAWGFRLAADRIEPASMRASA